MGVQLYLDTYRREQLIKPYYLFKDANKNRISRLFDNMEEEAKEMANEYYRESGKRFNPNYHDEGDFAAAAYEVGIEYFEAMALMDYTTKLSFISTMYQYWGQQVRYFLYDEIKRDGSNAIDKDGKEILFEYRPN